MYFCLGFLARDIQNFSQLRPLREPTETHTYVYLLPWNEDPSDRRNRKTRGMPEVKPGSSNRFNTGDSKKGGESGVSSLYYQILIVPRPPRN